MALLKYENLSEGPLPSEKIVQFRTLKGLEEIVVPQSQTSNGFLRVDSVGRDKDADRVLVELPRESVAGHWRVWVSSNMVTETT